MKLTKKQIIEKIMDNILNVLIFIFSIILLISIYSGVQTKILGNNYASFFGYSIFEVQTGSMGKVIKPGDWIVLELTQDVKVNDIITYELDGDFITHRIVESYEGTFITKGDANPGKDAPIDRKQVLGKVINVFGGLGLFRKTIFNPWVLITLIITIFLFNFAFKKKEEEMFNEKVYQYFDVLVKKIKKYLDGNDKLRNILNNITNKIKELFKIIKKDKTTKIENANVLEEVLEEIIQEPKIIENKDEEEPYKDEDELDKTSMFRMVSVDEKNVPISEELKVEEYYKDEDELDKTSVFRIVSVDEAEVDKTLLEIAKTELTMPVKEKIKEETTEPVVELEEDNDLTKINLDLLKNSISKKGKNIIDSAIIIKKEEINEIISIVVDDKKHVSKATIKGEFLNSYINAKYYNYYGDTPEISSRKNSLPNFVKVIEYTANKLISEYKGNNKGYEQTVIIYANVFAFIASIDKAKYSISDSKAMSEFYKSEMEKYLVEEEDTSGVEDRIGQIEKYFTDNNKKVSNTVEKIKKIQRNYDDMLEKFLDELDSNDFILNFSQLSYDKNMFGVSLEHNISFNRIYSEYIIDKTYSEGVIAEDKLAVLLTLLSKKMVEDVLTFDFDNKYYVYMVNSLYSKVKKLTKLLKLADDKHAKESMYIVIEFETLCKYKAVIKDLKKEGYKFAIIFDNNPLKVKNKNNLYLADYIFVDKKDSRIDSINAFIPKELKKITIYEDIREKTIDFGGEVK